MGELIENRCLVFQYPKNLLFRNAGQVSAGLLLDKSGCKGWTGGGLRISERHANFFVCNGTGVARDFTELMLRAQRRVYETTGIRLIPEVVFADPAMKDLLTGVKPLRIAVLEGGPSGERAVSLKSGAAVAKALREGGHDAVEIDVTRSALPDMRQDVDVVFPALHGTFGEDGQIQRLLEIAGYRYVGSGVDASDSIMDKAVTKEILVKHGVPTPKYEVITFSDADVPGSLTFPLIVKPNRQGSSLGVTRLNRYSGWWRRALRKAFESDDTVLAEEFVAGVEITVGLLNGRALPVIEIVPPGGRMFDYDAKYEYKQGHTQYLCPPVNVSQRVQKRAQDIGENVFHVLGAKDMLRVDLIVDNRGTPWVLEANSIPGFTATSLLPKAASAAGMSFVELCCGLAKRNVGVSSAKYDKQRSK